MKITMDRKYVEDYQVDRVKADMKEFKERYTDGDLLREFMDQTGNVKPYAADIVYCNVKAIDSGWAYGNTTCFQVSMLCDGIIAMYKLSFYIDMDLKVDTREPLVNFQEFKPV